MTPFTSVFTVNPAPPSNGAGFALFPARQPLVASFGGKSKSHRTHQLKSGVSQGVNHPPAGGVVELLARQIVSAGSTDSIW